MMNAIEMSEEAMRGQYILTAIMRYTMNGDAYVKAEEVYPLSKKIKPEVEYLEFQEDFKYLVCAGKLSCEESRVYLRETLRYEESAAKCLADILRNNKVPCPAICGELTGMGGITLCEEQRCAVRMAAGCRLSMILGGAGTGKTALIHAITQCIPAGDGRVLCAPTGKAARNLADKSGMIARTVHSALGVVPDADFLAPVCWYNVGLVVVDEASMMTLGMLAGILDRVRYDCRVVLLGDPYQLLSVGSGNVLPDLLRLGVPCVRLRKNHRQEVSAEALLTNVVGFAILDHVDDLFFDGSFILHAMEEEDVKRAIAEEAVARYKAGEDVQVLSPYNAATELSVQKLNRVIRDEVNPNVPGKLSLGERFRDGDRVIILNNDRERDCSNGDVGILRILSDDKENPKFYVELPDGRRPLWDDRGGVRNLALAYVLTVHKSQGSAYDTVLMPVVDSFSNMLYRNLIYTAISRARSKVILYGSKNALSIAMQRPARKRHSQLVEKCQRALMACAW